MKKMFFIFIPSVLLFSSCKAQIKEYEVLNAAFSQNYNSAKGCDTIDVLNKTVDFNNYFFETYTKEKNEREKGISSTRHIFVWPNQNEKWIFSNDDLKYFEVSKAPSMSLKKKFINKDNIKFLLVDRPIFENKITKSKEASKRILNCRFIYEFSTPIFNRDKTIAIIQRIEILVNESSYFIYKLKNKKWGLVGYTEHSSE